MSQPPAPIDVDAAAADATAKPAAATAKPRALRARWSSPSICRLLQSYGESRAAGYQSENGWKEQAHHAAAGSLALTHKTDGGAVKTAASCAGKWQSLKKDFIVVKKLKDLSGFGWDSEKKVVTADDDVWDRYLEKNPTAKCWRDTPFPWYEEFLDLVEGQLATGGAAFHPGAGGFTAQSDDASDHEEADTTVDDWELTPPPSPSIRQALSRKRSATEVDGMAVRPSGSAKKVRTKPPSAAGAVLEVADAMRSITSAFAGTSSTTSELSSPSRRSKAIKALTKSNLLTPRRFIKLVRHVQKNTYVADTFLALDDDETRTAYLEAELEDL